MEARKLFKSDKGNLAWLVGPFWKNDWFIPFSVLKIIDEMNLMEELVK